jgi:hypothetical protein
LLIQLGCIYGGAEISGAKILGVDQLDRQGGFQRFNLGFDDLVDVAMSKTGRLFPVPDSTFNGAPGIVLVKSQLKE